MPANIPSDPPSYTSPNLEAAYRDPKTVTKITNAENKHLWQSYYLQSSYENLFPSLQHVLMCPEHSSEHNTSLDIQFLSKWLKIDSF